MSQVVEESPEFEKNAGGESCQHKEDDDKGQQDDMSNSDESEVEAALSVSKKEASYSALSKNKFRKKRNHEKHLQNRALKRQLEREIRKQKRLKKSLGNEEKLAISERLKNAIGKAPKVIIDCQYDKQMSVKEQSRFAQQLRRAYSSNKACEEPLHLILASLSKSDDNPFFKICCKQNDGFAKYVIDMQEESVVDLYPNDKLVYLTPDSPNALTEFDPEKIYVIGGLVDETTTKNVSLQFAGEKQISTGRLPIDEYFMPDIVAFF
jgi:tRNA (guanine9-N1)-methyltransferase